MTEHSIDAQELAKLGQNLREAEEALQASDRALAAASRARADNLNRLNHHQKQLDSFIAKLKAASPADGDWKQRARAMNLSEREA